MNKFLNLKQGTVIRVLEQQKELTIVEVMLNDRIHEAINYHIFTGTPQPGDKIVLNTTAVDLGLGSGGYHFVVHNASADFNKDSNDKGHIMKLRYTPLQFKVLSVEEEESPHRHLLDHCSSLAGTPVVIGLLHSHLTPAVLALNWRGNGKLKLVYVMTDGGALPLAFSRQVAALKNKGLLVNTITVGHTFGGDLEGINLYSGLLAAKGVLGADIIIVAMGPGIVGTNSQFGFSGIEQGQIANAVTSLGGRPVLVPRISFADPRTRHQGLSHHSLTILAMITLCKTWVGLPLLVEKKEEFLWEQIRKAGLDEKHLFITKSPIPLAEELARFKLKISTMGRSYEEDRTFFDAAWASGLVAYDLWNTNSSMEMRA